MRFKDLELSALTDDEVLFFIRIRGKQSYFDNVYSPALLREFSSLRQFRTISEYPKDADVEIDLRSCDPHVLNDDERAVIAACIDELEVIRRCRALRNISYMEAKALILRAALFMIRTFRDSKLKLLVLGAVDNYVMDVMVRVAEHYGIRTLGVTEFLLAPRYKFVTVRGEHSQFFEPSDQQVEQVHGDLLKRARSALAITKSRAVRNAVYDLFSYYYRVVFRYVWGYRILGKLSYEHRFAYLFRNFHSLRHLTGIRYFSGLEALDGIDERKTVYIPLHLTPEASIDYWVKDSADADYLASLLKVVGHYQQRGWRVVLKEHPVCYLARDPSFYKALTEATGAVILYPFITTKSVFERIKQVVVWTGSTGVEAAVMGLDVKIVSENYYSNGLFKRYDQEGPSVLDEAQRRALVRRVLTTSLAVG